MSLGDADRVERVEGAPRPPSTPGPPARVESIPAPDSPMPSSRKTLPVALALLVTVAVAGPAAAQGETGFLRGKGKLDASLTYTLDWYDTFWVGTERVSMPMVGEVERETWSLHLAYGLRDDLDLVMSGALVESEADGAGGIPDVKDMQDLVLGLKWRFLHEPFAGGHVSLLAAPSIKTPMGTYPTDQVTAIGDGQTDLRGRVIAQYQHGSGTFLALETGYDIRNGSPDDEFPLHLTLGFTPIENLTLTPFYSRVWSEGGIDISDVPALGGFPAVREEYTRVGVGAYFRLRDDLGLTGMWRTTVDGRNTGEADAVSLGLVLRF